MNTGILAIDKLIDLKEVKKIITKSSPPGDAFKKYGDSTVGADLVTQEYPPQFRISAD